MKRYTPGPWKQSSKNASAVVAGEPHEGTYNDKENVDWYGGHMVVESVNKINMPLILAVPDLLEKFVSLVQDMDDLIGDSTGVVGLHHNGDVATWSELTKGGKFDEWLKSLDDAKDLLIKLKVY